MAPKTELVKQKQITQSNKYQTEEFEILIYNSANMSTCFPNWISKEKRLHCDLNKRS